MHFPPSPADVSLLYWRLWGVPFEDAVRWQHTIAGAFDLVWHSMTLCVVHCIRIIYVLGAPELGRAILVEGRVPPHRGTFVMSASDPNDFMRWDVYFHRGQFNVWRDSWRWQSLNREG